MNSRPTLSVFALLALLFVAGPLSAAEKLPPPAKKKIGYAGDILPILKKHCYECHGPETQEAGLRLDVRDRALAGSDTGEVIASGKSAESILIKLVAGLDPEKSMPPDDEKLSDEQIGLLRAWIDQGVDWPDELAGKEAPSKHWAFQPIARPPVPQVKNDAWVRNPIDNFILARLEQEGIAPSPPADRPTLIRRLSLDLLGLPPTPEQVDAFVADQRPDAYERLVKQMLDSPQFGERWARHWLDLARYADSDGYEKDRVRPFAWRWRDWVIQSINRDQPFDQFTIEQLAGDLLPDATLAQKVATGFHRNTLINREGGIDPEEDRVKRTVDRVNTTSEVWLGLTLGCAQCHSHKFDPFAQREYYQLFAFFNSLNEVDIAAPAPGEREAYLAKKKKFDAEHAPYQQAVDEFVRDKLPARLAEWEAGLGDPSGPRWTVLSAQAASAGGAKLTVQKDQSILAGGKNPDADIYTVIAECDLQGVTAVRLEVLSHASLPAKGPGRVGHGNFVLNELQIEAVSIANPQQPKRIKLRNASADHSQNGWAVAGAIDGDGKSGWAVAPQYGQPHVAVFETAEDIGFAGGTKLTFKLVQEYGSQHTIGLFRLSVTTDKRPVRAGQGLPDNVAKLLAIQPERRNDKQQAALLKYYRSIDSELAKLTKAAEDHAKKAPKDDGTKAQALAELSSPRKTHVMIRGDFLRPAGMVHADVPRVLPPLEAEGRPTRLDLARWLVDADNPLTSRVTVNRYWQYLFGRGLVATPDDFGKRGEQPSHPELLDWLAREFMNRGWSRKQFITLVVTSATYRQASQARPDLETRDAVNRLLARQNRLRVEAEVVRDLALASSGLLTEKIGGPSVRPPQPDGVSALTYANSAKWVVSKGADRYRRGLYIHFQRTSPYPMLMTFDSPDGNVYCLRRERSNTPLQALTLLNDKVFVECAQALARRVLAEAQGRDARIERVFRLCLGRVPSDKERSVLADLLARLHAAAEADPKAAAQLAGKPPEHTTPAEAAAWVALARTILNLDEFVTRE